MIIEPAESQGSNCWFSPTTMQQIIQDSENRHHCQTGSFKLHKASLHMNTVCSSSSISSSSSSSSRPLQILSGSVSSYHMGGLGKNPGCISKGIQRKTKGQEEAFTSHKK